MKLKSLAILTAVLVVADTAVWWRAARHDQRAGATLVDRTLLEVPQIERARRIVIREKPQSKTVEKNADGFEVRLVVDKDAPIRETVLERHDGGAWSVTNCFGLEADPVWLGETLRDLTRGRLTRFVTNEPELMQDLALNLGEVRLEDEHGAVIRRLEFGRKDGGDTYQFVRIDGHDAFVAKHETELVGDALSWVAGRLFRFEPDDVREIELPFTDANEPRLKLTRTERGAAFLADGKTDTALAAAAEKRAIQILREPVMVAFGVHAPVSEVARQHIAAGLRVVFFDGREYRVDYGFVPAGDPAAPGLAPYDDGTVAFGFWSCSDTKDVLSRQAGKAVFGYNRIASLGALPKNRAALLPSAGSTAPANASAP